ncbi:MAG: LamG domain-containing protein, partial [Planctomycetota bacterium]
MSKKLLCMACFVFVLSLGSIASAELVAHWPLDEGSGTTANDVTGNGNDGTLNGDPQWVAGMHGVGLEFDGDDFVDCGNQAMLNFGTGDFTITAWIQTTQPDRGSVFSNGGDNSGGIRYTFATHESNDDRMTLTTDDDSTKVQAEGATVVIDGQWYHVAAMRAGTETRVYVNGVLDGTNTVPEGYDLSGASQHNCLIGAMTSHTDGSMIKLFVGIIDDVRIYNTALTEPELQAAMQGQAFARALGPAPEDGALHADTWANLSWSAGDFAVSHDVYLDDNFDDVNNGTGDAFRGNQADTFYVAGFPGFAFPDGLVPGATYYWRIDEVNEAEPNSPWKGDVWSFSVPPKTAYFPDPIDGAEFVNLDATLNWTPGFGAKLHTVYLGDSFEDVNNATGGAPQGTATFAPASPLESEKVYYWRVDEFDVAATHKGDIWSFTT